MPLFSRLAAVVIGAILAIASGRAYARSANLSATLPLSTHSAPARQHFEKGMSNLENLRTDEALDEWRKAAAADPNFALAHMMTSSETRDPSEKRVERDRAKQLAARTTAGERLLITWLSSVQESDYVSGIAAMNDLQAQYPRDKRIAFLVGRWLILQNQFERGQHVLERALAIDSNYAPAYNEIGYAYAYAGQYDRANRAMEKYAALLPSEPNPQDSYAEILRMAGNYPAALEHYRDALKIDAKFTSSQLGLGDTYALMGNQEQARAEYAKAISAALSEAERDQYAIQAAQTWVRETKFDEADKAFQSIIEKTGSAGLALTQAQVSRMMAEYAPDAVAAKKDLDRSDAILKPLGTVSKTDADEEHARVLAVRCERAIADGNSIPDLQKVVSELEQLSQAGPSDVVHRAYHGCAGRAALADGRFADAISDLQEDTLNPLSLRRLSEAYEKSGDLYQAQAVRKQIAAFSTPTLEQAIAVAASPAAK
jgi:tetratricopeptide (TPR) repeat protein